jgi:hypothetical protein
MALSPRVILAGVTLALSWLGACSESSRSRGLGQMPHAGAGSGGAQGGMAGGALGGGGTAGGRSGTSGTVAGAGAQSGSTGSGALAGSSGASGASGSSSLGGAPGAGGEDPGGAPSGGVGADGGAAHSIDITPVCPEFTPCGGDPVGRWHLAAVCGGFSQATNLPPECSAEYVSETALTNEVYDFGADGTLVVTGALTRLTDLALDDACAAAQRSSTAADYCTAINTPPTLPCTMTTGGTGNAGGTAGGGGGANCAGAGGSSSGSSGTSGGMDGAGGSRTVTIGGVTVSEQCSYTGVVCACHIVEGPIQSSTTVAYEASGTDLVVAGSARWGYCVEGEQLRILSQPSPSDPTSITTLERER